MTKISRTLFVAMFLCAVAMTTAATDASRQKQVLPDGVVSGLPAECDTVVDVDGYAVHVKKGGDGKIQAGLDVFSPQVKEMIGPDMAATIATVLLEKARGIERDDGVRVDLTSGTVSDFRHISPATDCRISKADTRRLTAEWNVDDRKVAVSVPVGYQSAKGGTRKEIEDTFIRQLKDGGAPAASCGVEIDRDKLHLYVSDSIYVAYGSDYHNKDITNDIYAVVDSDGNISPVWHAGQPLESIADMFVYPADGAYGDPTIEMTVLKHEYGEQEKLTVGLRKFLAVCEADGCTPYWGVEKFADGHLEGALFMVNPRQGYNHTFKIDCMPADVIGGKGVVKARASLYVPVNNIRDLYEPYKKKTEKERIKYDEK
ncbi:MAG: hypothetical protein Q4F07_05800 [Bacteroidales bacterium]|nr:hypothetical protein [Bacteroidales bacterium]